jgi:hypothetical protein
VKFSSPTFLTISSNALCLIHFSFVLCAIHVPQTFVFLYRSIYLHVNLSFHFAGILNTQTVLLQPKQITRTGLLLAHYWQVGVHTRQVKGRLLACIGGGRQAASKIELGSIHLPCLAACQVTCLASKFRKVIYLEQTHPPRKEIFSNDIGVGQPSPLHTLSRKLKKKKKKKKSKGK